MKSLIIRPIRQHELKGILLVLLVIGLACNAALAGIAEAKADRPLFSIIPIEKSPLTGDSGSQSICHPSWFYTNYGISTVRSVRVIALNKPHTKTHSDARNVACTCRCNVSPEYEEIAFYSINYPHNALDYILYLYLDTPPPFFNSV